MHATPHMPFFPAEIGSVRRPVRRRTGARALRVAGVLRIATALWLVKVVMMAGGDLPRLPPAAAAVPGAGPALELLVGADPVTGAVAHEIRAMAWAIRR